MAARLLTTCLYVSPAGGQHQGSILEPSISDYEISIIKGLLRMNYRPALVQAYFTRPDRLVNPARIQEIKTNATARVAAIASASDEDVGDFLDAYARANPANEQYSPPIQENDVNQFKLTENGKITIVSAEADLLFGTPEIKEIYDELRIKAVDLITQGHNGLGEIHNDVSRFRDALPEDALDASVIRIFMRGSGLKSKLASYDAHKQNPEIYPVVDLEPGIVPLFRDLVESFTLLVNLTPAMAVLEGKATTNEQYLSQGEALEAIKPALDGVEQIAEPEAAEALGEQISDGLNAPQNQSGRNQRAVAFSSVRNFAISIFTPVYHAARYILGNDKLPIIAQHFRNGLAYAAGQKFYPYLHDRFPAIVEYVKNNAESLTAYAEKIITNQQLHEFIRAMIEIIRSIP